MTGTSVFSQLKSREIVRTKHELERMLLTLRKEPVIAVDTETTGLDWQNLDTVVGVSFAVEERSWYVVIGTALTRTRAPLEIVEADLHEFFAQERVWVWHNAKFDLHMLGLIPAGTNEDTMLMMTVLDPERLQVRGALQLKTLAREVLGVETGEQDELNVYMKEHGLNRFSDVPIGILAPYACADVEYTFALYRKLLTTLRRRQLERVYDLERRLVPVIVRMEEAGVPLDIEYLKRIRAELEQQLSAAFDSLEKAGVMGAKGVSPAKLLVKLREQGNRIKDTREVTLEKLNGELPRAVVAYRGLMKLHGTYVTNLIDKSFNGRISMDLRQFGARTGRMSCASPNLQNIPNRDGEDMIRKAFVCPGPEWSMLYADYSQIEMVLFAEISNDRRLQQAVIDGADLHATTAAVLYDKPIDAVTKAERSAGKTLNFSIVYGQGIPSTAIKLGVSEAEARRIRARYFKAFPAIKSVQERVQNLTKSRGYAKTLWGRVRPIPGDKAYVGLNTTIQGTAADVMKVALIRIDHYLRAKKSKLLLCIHDEVMIQQHESEQVAPTVVQLMTRRMPLKLPLRVDVKWSRTNWAEKKELV